MTNKDLWNSLSKTKRKGLLSSLDLDTIYSVRNYKALPVFVKKRLNHATFANYLALESLQKQYPEDSFNLLFPNEQEGKDILKEIRNSQIIEDKRNFNEFR